MSLISGMHWLQIVWRLLRTVGALFWQVKVMYQTQPAQSWPLGSNLQLVSALTGFTASLLEPCQPAF